MVSFRLRRVFYNAAAGAEGVLNEKRQKLLKLEEIENQTRLAKMLLNKLENEEYSDAAALIRMEGKLKKLENRIRQSKSSLSY